MLSNFDKKQIKEYVDAINEAPHLASYIYKEIDKECPQLKKEIKRQIKEGE